MGHGWLHHNHLWPLSTIVPCQSPGRECLDHAFLANHLGDSEGGLGQEPQPSITSSEVEATGLAAVWPGLGGAGPGEGGDYQTSPRHVVRTP
jgi:hypothetical protein